MTIEVLMDALGSMGPVGVVAAIGLVILNRLIDRMNEMQHEANQRIDQMQREANERSERQFAIVSEIADRFASQSEKTSVSIERLATLIDERVAKSPPTQAG